jgi:hypothetical protein
MTLRIATLVFAALLASGCDTSPVRQNEASMVQYGPKPNYWQDSVRSYLKLRLVDPTAAIIEFRTQPQQLYQRKVGLRDTQYGWAVCVWVNDKNREGHFDGFYPMTFFIRDEKIVAVNNGPDDFGIIGATYAREQCKQLGAPFEQ